jgi:hypothetical protein
MISMTLLILPSPLVAENHNINQSNYGRISRLRKRLHRTVREISSFVKSNIPFESMFSLRIQLSPVSHNCIAQKLRLHRSLLLISVIGENTAESFALISQKQTPIRD